MGRLLQFHYHSKIGTATGLFYFFLLVVLAPGDGYCCCCLSFRVFFFFQLRRLRLRSKSTYCFEGGDISFEDVNLMIATSEICTFYVFRSFSYGN